MLKRSGNQISVWFDSWLVLSKLFRIIKGYRSKLTPDLLCLPGNVQFGGRFASKTSPNWKQTLTKYCLYPQQRCPKSKWSKVNHIVPGLFFSLIEPGGEGPGGTPISHMYFQKYWCHRNEPYIVRKASKNVYFSDSHVLIMTSSTPKWRHMLKQSAILDSPSWISIFFRNVKKSPNMIWKNRKKYKDAKTVKIFEETFHKKRKSHETAN